MDISLKEGKYALAISGGIDSMVLLDIMLKKGLEVILVHFNHLTRGQDNQKDYELIKKIAEKNNLKLYYKEQNFKNEKRNFHAAAHDARYDFFYEVLKIENCDLVLAHHGDDLIENQIMSYLRGASIKGYAGFSEKSVFHEYSIRRPLIAYSKVDIIKYQTKHFVEYNEDLSNSKLDYTRNKIRHTFLPLIPSDTINKSIQFANTLFEVDDYLSNQASEYIEKGIKPSTFKNLHNALKRKVVSQYLKSYAIENNFNKIDSIVKLLSDETATKTVDLDKELFLIKEYDNVNIKKRETTKKIDFLVTNAGKYENEYYFIDVSLDKLEKYDKIISVNFTNEMFPFRIRNRKNGDMLKLDYGRKKLSRVMIDSKIPTTKRDELIVVEKDDIIFVENIFSKKGNNKLFIAIKEKDYGRHN